MIARVELLVHMLDVVMDQERKKTPEQKKITIKDLEIYTWAETARWFNGENGKNQNKRIFLEEIFRVAKMEERYRKGELGMLAKHRAISIAYIQQMAPLQSEPPLVTDARILTMRTRTMSLK
jgi:hypothetical protein